MNQASSLELAVELSLAPARVPGEDSDPGHLAGHVLMSSRRRSARSGRTRPPRAAGRCTRRARSPPAAAPGRRRTRIAVVELGQLGHRLGDRQLGGPVQDDAERTLLGVLDDQHDGAVEVGVDQHGRRDQKLALERTAIGMHSQSRVGR